MKAEELFSFVKKDEFEPAFVEYYSADHNIILTRFERVLKRDKDKDKGKWMYFVYIFKKDSAKGKKDNLGISVYNKIFHSYEEFMGNLYYIVGEYLVDNHELQRCMKLAKKLDPNYFNEQGN
ncbi:hypothetical protein KGF86_01770 [Ornithinibacillus massiliensis]|uniref:Uncharacterized protein n=1 Tax=Ornithinibacillus massiliensis TaxID=1944633 RepID=A0ABS5MAF6_9BACI|nr:hypothetical protein [Ornithinibacillus massiliensis]MBS3678932.1 hypothetical protein [Ornithinibacillus massiliensis]